MTDIVKIVNDQVGISEDVQVVKGLYFELTEPVSISGIKQNSNHIKLEFDPSNTNLLIGFRIRVNLQKKDQTMEAYRVVSS